jgi:uncharacterized protein DUF4136
MTLLLTLALLASATSSVEYDHQADFARYKTWGWHEGGTPALNPATNKKIQDAIEKGLATHGLARVDKDPALLVVYYASRTTQIDIAPADFPSPAPPSGIRVVQKGALVIDMLDASTKKVVWRGHASDVMKYGPKDIAAQVEAAVADLLARFPPSAP